MKTRVFKIISCALCAAIVFSGAGAAGYALAEANESKSTNKDTQTVSEPAASENTGASKDETVYVLANADGSVKKIIVSDWIKNIIGNNELNDKSELTDIENVKGDESYTIGSDNAKIWDANGNDIYYQGNIEKELPVGLSVTYKLDGKTVSPSELAGKSGKVTIRFDYTNNQYENVDIDGKQEKIYVPFAMLTGMLLDNDTFTNVEVSNGKLINDGNRTAIVGIAFPGLQENLGVSTDKFEIPNYVEITADAKDFELGMTVTIATNEIFNEIDPDSIDLVSDLTGSVDKLSDAMNQLMTGSSQLYDGLCTLLDKSGELVNGITALAEGAGELKDGAKNLDFGAESLQNGASELYAGLDTLNSKNSELNGGARKVFETLLATANTQLAEAGLDVPVMTVENYADVLNGVISSLDKTAVYNKALAQVTAAVEAKRLYIKTQVTSTVVTSIVREAVSEQAIQTATGMDKETYLTAVENNLVDSAIQSAIEQGIDAKMSSDAIAQIIAVNTQEQMTTPGIPVQTQPDPNDMADVLNCVIRQNMAKDDIQALIAQNTEAQVQKAISENMAGDEVQSQLYAASEGAKSVISLKASLDSYNTFYLGLKAYTAGVSEAAIGAGELKNGTDAMKDGTSALCDGASELYNGILTLKNGAPALVDGITQLCDGSMKLSDGLKEFNEQGVQKLIDAVDGDLAGLMTRVRATCDVSKDYKSFSGISDEMDGQVKFIYRTDSIENQD